MSSLPRFIPPMLCKLGRKAFDSDEHLFEVKWDGTRGLAFCEGGRYRLRNRRDKDLVPGYPELDGLARLPSGLVLDGEVVIFKDGKPSFPDMLVREQARSEQRARELARTLPAVYVVFDVIWAGGRDLSDEPLRARREVLGALFDGLDEPRIILSEGIVGAGIALYDKAFAEDLEGIVAKRLESGYESDQRSGAWTKIKTFQQLYCVVLGWVPDGPDDFKSLIVGADEAGALRCVGKVGTGFDARKRARVNRELASRVRDDPVVPCPFEGRWVEPELFCSVSYLERTSNGMLRAPVFVELIDAP